MTSKKLTDEEAINTALLDFLRYTDAQVATIEGQTAWSDDDVHVVTDHCDDLPKKAVCAMHADEHWFAILFYATWLEHWVNNVLMSLSVRSGVPEGAAVALVRSCSFHVKIKDVWTSLKAAPLGKAHIRMMTDLMEFRNGFVHYKWQSRSISDKDAYDQRVKEVAVSAQNLVTILEELEDQLLFSGRRKALRAQLGLNE
ncbi:hypothetical protein [Streptomyces sp. MK37H]|uniref:hypothetical protein n=1 Tax=Streptomyces sp. MK37H TaxID=2699117 RepID=UPI001B371299|nr:hypothetical protein [Streptomyces sp. MK37H]MBP8537135.1 hypothetical protein [Streptomyces sp. MK37H]